MDNKPTPELEKRMYFLVPYNISPIQQAIQAGHAALEYAHKYKNDPEYIDYIENWKTWIILNGGTTNSTVIPDTGMFVGSLDNTYGQIWDFNIENPNIMIKTTSFNEPDLNNALTAICMVIDERVFNRVDYPSFDEFVSSDPYASWMSQGSQTYLINEDKYRENHKELFGDDYEKIMFLKELLNTKKLA